MRQLLINELTLNPSVAAEDEARLSRQAVRVWRLFISRDGNYQSVWTNRLRAEAAQYCARVNEIRNWLRKYDLTIDCTERDIFGNHKYEVCNYEGSRYQAMLRKKGIE